MFELETSSKLFIITWHFALVTTITQKLNWRPSELALLLEQYVNYFLIINAAAINVCDAWLIYGLLLALSIVLFILLLLNTDIFLFLFYLDILKIVK